MRDYKKLAAPYYEEAVKKLGTFVNIDSVYDEATVSEKDPYGKGVTNALEFISDLAKKDGFTVKNINNRVIEISIGNINKNNVAIFAHADVVPATGNWISPPFKATIRDDYMYGRGTSDDKGPVIASYYALKLLRDHNLITNYSVRLVVGGDEERGSSCMNYYFNDYAAPHPKAGFTPDAIFPLIYAEKGIVNYVTKKQFAIKHLYKLEGGEAANSVIDKVTATLDKDLDFLTYLNEKAVNYEYETAGDKIKLTVYGLSSHGSYPEKGENAAITFLTHFSAFYDDEELTKISYYYSDVNGRNLNAYANTKLVGETTFNVGLISYDGNELSLTVNFRFPETIDTKIALRDIKELTGMSLKCDRVSPVLLFDPESDFIQTLMSAYQDETGDLTSKPLAIGGGTYAKECPNTVAFGSSFPERRGDIHAPNEYIALEDLKIQISMYARAIYYLGTKL
ncbi:MAG TPA: Sapep family Mn(2+)-dependent dipeptidase [Bacilli bacterium]|nr:Sapep family Mn(2+)-dependent dipeptidase [Bacilli bacterium]